MSSPQIFLLSFIFGALLHLLIRQPILAGVLAAAAIIGYETFNMLSVSYAGGGASMWPIALFFVVAFTSAGAALGVFAVAVFRKRKQ